METRIELSLLAALAPGPRPARALLDELRRRGGAETPGAVFETLRGLERRGFVARGPWRLTPRGRARLARERSAWLGLARTVAAALAA
jgi:DNA-binding PadR family transcriptional regulator